MNRKVQTKVNNITTINFNGAVQTVHLAPVAPVAPPAETATAARHPPTTRKAPKRRCYRCNRTGHAIRQCLAPRTTRRKPWTPAVGRGGSSSTSMTVRPPRSLRAKSRTRTPTPELQPLGTSTPMRSPPVSNIFNPNSAK
ncbi:uncharacterized protein LOC115034686 [Acyrthosiphon pisum]|uniref:CCHC-type domain-containing protein n=1 Tax=Acyrthosiphon pisum TaxID=7029 RepID=A0A8R2NX83_ACYPI|nr:uncharacterized protein LOC115034686 [Acyrthosiphon pisum]